MCGKGGGVQGGVTRGVLFSFIIITGLYQNQGAKGQREIKVGL